MTANVRDLNFSDYTNFKQESMKLSSFAFSLYAKTLNSTKMNKSLLRRVFSSLVLLLALVETRGSCTTEEVNFIIKANSDVERCPIAPWQTVVYGYNIFIGTFNELKASEGMMMTSIDPANSTRRLRRFDRKLVKGKVEYFWGPRKVTAQIEVCSDDENPETTRRKLTAASDAVFDPAVREKVRETLAPLIPNLCMNDIILEEAAE